MNEDTLKKIGQMIDEKLKPLSDSINNPERGFNGINQKLDSISAEMIELNKKVGATYDLVKFSKEKNEAEFDEIRTHTGMPPAQREPLKFTE